MQNNKNDEVSADDKRKQLEQKVDAMMDPKLPDAASPQASATSGDSLPVIDIFSDPKTAPAVPKELLSSLSGIADKKADVEPAATAAPTDNAAKLTESGPDLTLVESKITTGSVEPEPELLAQEEDILADDKTEAAVDDITATEADELLKAQDAAALKSVPAPRQRSFWKSKKIWFLLPVVVLGIVATVPFTRYKVLALFMKQSVSVVVLDSKTATPVSSATVKLNGLTAETDSTGKVVLDVPVGPVKLSIEKEYYKVYDSELFVPVTETKTFSIDLVATGRQVPVSVVNRITRQPIAGAEVRVLDTKATTDKKGLATIVLPTDKDTQAAKVRAAGFNETKVTITVTGKVTPQNTFAVTPVGKVYFLSNLSGKIDVVKSNLDGSERHTVLAGTGKEDAAGTSLIASQDWRYLALISIRGDSKYPKVYLIDTATDKLTTADDMSANFKPVGWQGHIFVYTATHEDAPKWIKGRQELLSFNAAASKTIVLDKTEAVGEAETYAYQTFRNSYVLDSLVVYDTAWISSEYDSQHAALLKDKASTIRSVQTDGQNKKDYKMFAAQQYDFIQSQIFAPRAIYFGAYNYASKNYQYFSLKDGNLADVTDIDQSSLSPTNPTYIASPAGDHVLWAEARDGKSSLFIGDAGIKTTWALANSTGYLPYGWYTEDYLLVSRGDGELYVMPADTAENVQPVKVTDYYKSNRSVKGYNYGYGGL